MLHYAVKSSLNGQLYGLYEADSKAAAIEAMAKDFGFADFNAMVVEHDPHEIFGYRRSFDAHEITDPAERHCIRNDLPMED